MEAVVLVASLLLQLCAAALALRLLRRSSSAWGWVLIAGAIVLMVSRRAATLFEENTHAVALMPEMIGLAISVLMVAGVALLGTTFDRLREAKRLVRDRERDVREMLEGTPDGLLLARDRAWVYANPTATRLLRLDPASERDLATIVGESNRERVLDGPLHEEAEPGTGVDLTLEGRAQTTIELVAGPFVEHGGSRARLFVVRDLTERKLMEASLLQAQKMEALGQMAGGIAHDINNLLTVINASTEVAKRALRKNKPVDEDLDAILDASERAHALTSQLLAFSRHGVTKTEALSLGALVQGARPLLQTLVGDSIQIELGPTESQQLVDADRSQLEQVLVNLAANARDAMPDGGRLLIATRDAKVEGRAHAPWAGARPDDYVVLSVTDTGTGIDPEVKTRIFDPFFTTKAPGKGTGMGLATCFAIARRMSGTITVDSRPGAGTTFEVWLPVSSEDGPAPRPSPLRSQPLVARGRRILVVDDDATVRAVATRVLQQAGFEVDEAESGDRALALVERRADIAAVFSDLSMPGMSGIQLADVIHKRWPTIPVLLTSGYAEELETRPDLDCITKPYRVDDLVNRLAATIARQHEASDEANTSANHETSPPAPASSA